jgi:hypothetical protein
MPFIVFGASLMSFSGNCCILRVVHYIDLPTLIVPLAITYLSWLIPEGLIVMVMIAGFRRKLWAEFPFFLSYLVFCIIITIIELITYNTSYRSYFWSYWISDAVRIIIKFLVIYEIFMCALKPYASLSRLIRILFVWTSLVLILVGIATASMAPVADRSPLIQSILTLKRTMSIIQMGLLFFLFLFVRVFAIPWRHYLFGITLGFALYGTVESGSFAVRTWGIASNEIVSWGIRAADFCATIVWVSYFAMLRRQPVQLRTEPVSPLREWNDALREVLSNSGVTS